MSETIILMNRFVFIKCSKEKDSVKSFMKK